MAISVKYFARIAEELGRREDELSGRLPGSAKDVWCQATGLTALPPNVLIAINQEYVQPDEAVHDGDEVAFFPPVTGG